MYELLMHPWYTYNQEALLIARVLVGITMIHFGKHKILKPLDNAKDFDKMGFKPGMFWGTIVALVEFVGGIALIAGLFTALVAILFGFQMFVGALWKISKKKTFSDISYDFILLAVMLLLLTYGPGTYTLFF